MTPKTWTFRHPIEYQVTSLVADVDPTRQFDVDTHSHLDGAGGIHSSDPRMRAVWWSWIQYYWVPEDLEATSRT